MMIGAENWAQVSMPVMSVDALTLHQWLSEGSATLLDVREISEYRARHIHYARHVPLGKIDTVQLPDHGRIVVHCLKGRRGMSACEKLSRRNPKLELYNLAGGIDAWASTGLPLVGGNPRLPLDRQVQLTIGIGLLAASAMALFVSPLFIAIAAAFGAGLVTAGATGNCALARVVARAPWNK